MFELCLELRPQAETYGHPQSTATVAIRYAPLRLPQGNMGNHQGQSQCHLIVHTDSLQAWPLGVKDACGSPGPRSELHWTAGSQRQEAGGLGLCALVAISPKAASALLLGIYAHRGWAKAELQEERAVPGSLQQPEDALSRTRPWGSGQAPSQRPQHGSQDEPGPPDSGKGLPPDHTLLASLSSNYRHTETHMQVRAKAPTRGCDICLGKSLLGSG